MLVFDPATLLKVLIAFVVGLMSLDRERLYEIVLIRGGIHSFIGLQLITSSASDPLSQTPIPVHDGWRKQHRASNLLTQNRGADVSMKDLIVILERIVEVDDGRQTICVLNSQVTITTRSITEIVTRGPRIVPVLLEIMKCENISFDTFARCYSACDQILRSVDPKFAVYWEGGCTMKETRSGITRVHPRGQSNEREFRKKVVADVIDKYRELSKRDEAKH